MLGLVGLVIEEENFIYIIFFLQIERFFLVIFIYLTFFLQIERFFLVILTLHNSKTRCDLRKPIVDLESTSKNTSINE